MKTIFLYEVRSSHSLSLSLSHRQPLFHPFFFFSLFFFSTMAPLASPSDFILLLVLSLSLPLVLPPLSSLFRVQPLLPTAPSRHLPPTRRPVRARNHHFTTRYSTNSNLLAMSQFLYGSFSLSPPRAPLLE